MNKALWLSLLFSLPALAKGFHNSYISFDLPDGWNCSQQGVVFICTPSSSSSAREALIIVTAKVAGPEDTLQAFTNYLKKPKALLVKSRPTMSQPLSTTPRKLSNIQWVESQHYGSEVPGFTTTYLATVRENLAILLSFSADRNLRNKYGPIFSSAMNSIRIDQNRRWTISQPNNRHSNIEPTIASPNKGPEVQASAPVPRGRSKGVVIITLGIMALVAIFLVRRYT